MLVPVTGMVADALGLPTTLTILAVLPLCAAALATQLPAAPPLPMHVEPVEVNVAAIDPSADDDASDERARVASLANRGVCRTLASWPDHRTAACPTSSGLGR